MVFSPMVNGWLNVYKPKNRTSFQIVKSLKKILNIKKIGHSGTLDPMAEGVLPMAVGKATKTIPFMMNKEKIYFFEITWGIKTDTEDLEGKIIEKNSNLPNADEIQKALKHFSGEIDQVPPIYSACKINGKRAYALARNNEPVSLKPKKVFIKSIKMNAHKDDISQFEVTCGKGTYVRSISRDLGNILGKICTVSAIVRKNVGPFNINNSINIENIPSHTSLNSCIMDLMQPIGYVLDDIPAYNLSAKDYDTVCKGQHIAVASCDEKTVSLKCFNEVIGIGKIIDNTLYPKKIWR